MKKAFGLLLIITLLINMITTVSAWEEGEMWGDFEYKIENGKAVIIYYNIEKGELNIPEEINGYKVAGIRNSAINLEWKNITSITIPDGIEYIGRRAFYGCSGVEEITIPETVTSIGDEAFYGCSSLKTITIPKNVTSIGVDCFSYCEGIISANVLSNVIGEGMFIFCKNLKTVILSENVKKIADYAFHHCDSLELINIPVSVINIGKNAFAFTNLKSITIPENVIDIGYNAFMECKNLKNVVFENLNTTFKEYNDETPRPETAGLNLRSFAETENLSTMYAFKGSQAQSYSLNNNLEFVPIANVEVNGERVKSDIPAIIKNNRVLIPMRAIFEKFGAEVDWNGETRTVTAAAGDKMIVMQIGEEEIGVNGEIKEIDVAPQMLMNRTIVPARAVSESLGAAVQWDEARQTVVINY